MSEDSGSRFGVLLEQAEAEAGMTRDEARARFGGPNGERIPHDDRRGAICALVYLDFDKQELTPEEIAWGQQIAREHGFLEEPSNEHSATKGKE